MFKEQKPENAKQIATAATEGPKKGWRPSQRCTDRGERGFKYNGNKTKTVLEGKVYNELQCLRWRRRTVTISMALEKKNLPQFYQPNDQKAVQSNYVFI